MNKYCKGCDQTKLLSEFGNDRRFKDGKRFYCKECNTKSYKKWYYDDIEKSKEVSKQWRERNPDKRQKMWDDYKIRDKDLRLQRVYGITLDQYTFLLHKQNFLCAICECEEVSKNRSLAVDHCHETGEVRGLLCSLCNRGIGMLQHDILLLEKAVSYLKESTNDSVLRRPT